jgi:putative acetyltransferase
LDGDGAPFGSMPFEGGAPYALHGGMTTIEPLEPQVAAPAWTIRPELPLDLDLIHDLHRSAFPGPAEAELVDAIRSGPNFVPELSLVAVTPDGTVLGHAMASRVGYEPIEAGAERMDVLALAPVAVLPPHQGRGIGSALIGEVLALADTRDEPFTVVLGAPSLYGAFGFEPAADLGVTGPYADAGDAFAVRRHPDGRAVLTGTVVYPAVFDEV